jgi:hypothetical protein
MDSGEANARRQSPFGRSGLARCAPRKDSQSLACDRDFLIGTKTSGLARRSSTLDAVTVCRSGSLASNARRRRAGKGAGRGLDAFRRHLHAEAAAETDHRVNDGRGIGGLFDRTHETRIDLKRFVSPADCICTEGNTLPPLDISAAGKIASKSLRMACNLQRKSPTPGIAGGGHDC